MKPDSNLVPRRPGLMYRLMMGLLGRFDRWVHQSCRTFIHRASEAFERPLTGRERLGQAAHRVLCSLCRTQERRLGQLSALAHEVAATGPETPGLSDEARERIRRAMTARPPSG